jgi:hypothetical protein
MASVRAMINSLVRKMSAFLRHGLIFDLDGIRSRTFEDAHAVPDVQGIAKTCLRINEDRNVHGLADRGGMLCNFGQSDEPKIRHPPKRICYPGAG